jgi:hypothetical protein
VLEVQRNSMGKYGFVKVYGRSINKKRYKKREEWNVLFAEGMRQQ